MSTFEISKSVVDILKVQTKFEPEMILSSLNCWFKGYEQVRCPFPIHMHNKLPDLAVIKFLEWTDKLSAKAREEVNDEMLLEKFEEILFSHAHKFAETEEEKLTIKYPFLVRTGDVVMKDNAENIIKERKVRKEGDQLFMDVVLEKTLSKENWTTSFELPEY
jgi:hypothetical protein